MHNTEFPAVEEYPNAEEVKANAKKMLDVRSTVLKALEDARNEKMIKSNQEASIQLGVPEDVQALFSSNLDSALSQWLIVSNTEVSTSEEVTVKVEKASGTKCPRCWNYSVNPDEDDLCPRCHAVLKK